MERKLLSTDEIAAATGPLSGWAISDDGLSRRFEFADFAASLAFVNRIGEIAEEMDHHPDITFGWGFAVVTTITHDRGGITDVDVELARRVTGIT